MFWSAWCPAAGWVSQLQSCPPPPCRGGPAWSWPAPWGCCHTPPPPSSSTWEYIWKTLCQHKRMLGRRLGHLWKNKCWPHFLSFSVKNSVFKIIVSFMNNFNVLVECRSFIWSVLSHWFQAQFHCSLSYHWWSLQQYFNETIWRCCWCYWPVVSSGDTIKFLLTCCVP